MPLAKRRINRMGNSEQFRLVCPRRRGVVVAGVGGRGHSSSSSCYIESDLSLVKQGNDCE